MSRLAVLLAAVFLVSTAGLFAHRALAEATPLAIAAWRLGLAALFFLGWSALGLAITKAEGRQPNIPLPRSVWGRLSLAGLCLALHFLVWFAALEYTSIARATLLVCTTPLWTTLGSLLLKRRPVAKAYWAALALAAVGVGLVTGASVQTQTPLVARGDLLATFGGVLFASYLLLVEGLHVTFSSRRQVTVAYSVAALMLWALLLLHGPPPLTYSPGVWSALLGMTLGPQIFGHTLLNWSLHHFPSSTIAFSILLEPIIAALLAWWLFHQSVTLGQALGGLLVLASLAVVIAIQTPTEAP